MAAKLIMIWQNEAFIRWKHDSSLCGSMMMVWLTCWSGLRPAFIPRISSMIFSASTLSIGSYFASCIFNSFLEETDVLLTAATFTRVFNYLQHISSQHGLDQMYLDSSLDIPSNIPPTSSIILKSSKRTRLSFLDSFIYLLHTPPSQQITMRCILFGTTSDDV